MTNENKKWDWIYLENLVAYGTEKDVEDFIKEVEQSAYDKAIEVVEGLINTKTNLDDDGWNMRNVGGNEVCEKAISEITKLKNK